MWCVDVDVLCVYLVCVVDDDVCVLCEWCVMWCI